MSKMKKFSNLIVDKENGKDVFDIFELIHLISELEGIDLDDMKGSSISFDKWCNKNNLPEIDAEGKERSQSKIWFKKYQSDLEAGIWVCPEYCSLITLLCCNYDCQVDEIYEMDLNDLLIRAKVKDIEQYGKEDYRTDGVNILKKHLEDTFYFTNKEC